MAQTRHLSQSQFARHAFSLVEISIVILIIGLIAGAVLAGRSLISSASARAQINQLRQYQMASETFRTRYGYYPGDVTSAITTRAGLAARGATAGKGDGNGIIEGVDNTNANSGERYLMGENVAFWADLSTMRLIEGTYTGSPTVSNTSIPALFPKGNQPGTYVHIWSGQTYSDTAVTNHFAVNRMDGGMSAAGIITSAIGTGVMGFTPLEAFEIDVKYDDGLPLSGIVTATYNQGGGSGTIVRTNTTYATTPIANGTGTCFNDNNALTNPWVYSANQVAANCGISVKFE